MENSELTEILREKLSRATWRKDWSLTIHLFFIEYAKELKNIDEADIIEIITSAEVDKSFITEYRKLKKIAQYVKVHTSYPPKQ